MSAHRDIDKVAEIYRQPNYPKHHPNTVKPDYSVTMNAKYDALSQAITDGLVTTKYIAWLDIGCFRDLMGPIKKANGQYSFKLEVPEHFNDSTVSYSRIAGDDFKFFNNKSAWDFIKENSVWVGGAFFVSTKPVMVQYISDYRSAVKDLLDENMASTDQQVVAALYSRTLRTKPSVDLTLHRCEKHPISHPDYIDFWFCIAYKCKKAAEARTLLDVGTHLTQHK